MRIRIILFVFSSCLFANEINVGIVGYTLLDSFKIFCDDSAEVVLDGKRISYRDFGIDSNGFLIVEDKEIIFNEIAIRTQGITTFLSGKGYQPYRGNFLITYDNSLKIINIVNEDIYLSSVLGSEMGANFEDEALKAQLLCIKAFLDIRKERNKHKKWDILNTAMVMAYRGEEYSSDRMFALVDELKEIKLILPDDMEPLFFSTASGYIISQECFSSTFDSPPNNPLILLEDNKTSPYYHFSLTLSEIELMELIDSIIPVLDIKQISLKLFNNTECVDFIGFSDSDDRIFWLKGYKFVSLIQRKYGAIFKSIQFSVYKENSIFEFSGKGFGHFIGLSQYGAQEMALNNKSYQEILFKFFPGSKISGNS
ncbi:MAG: hypothetical protein GY760_21170 [Deltaproteobacteria bacterium]|nr:hypothetical protein [Deltaproteobacteria bacterium]